MMAADPLPLSAVMLGSTGIGNLLGPVSILAAIGVLGALAALVLGFVADRRGQRTLRTLARRASPAAGTGPARLSA